VSIDFRSINVAAFYFYEKIENRMTILIAFESFTNKTRSAIITSKRDRENIGLNCVCESILGVFRELAGRPIISLASVTAGFYDGAGNPPKRLKNMVPSAESSVAEYFSAEPMPPLDFIILHNAFITPSTSYRGQPRETFV
jgi:hypothetical protein